jgi:D-glycero-alpha-D-manno-heptose 1-phosphate guanylyltransferase
MTTAIILAGGLGTRLRGLVSELPKPMAPIKNKPFLHHQMEYWIGQGVSKFILSVGYKSEIIIENFGNSFLGVPVEYSIENSPMGTGGGLLLATRQLNTKEPFLLLNGDTYFDVHLNKLKSKFEETNADMVFSLFESKLTERYLGFEVASEKITNINVRAELKNSMVLVNGGVYLIGSKALDVLRTLHSAGENFSLESSGFTELLAAKLNLFFLKSSGNFIDIGVPEDYLKSQRSAYFKN